MWEYLLKVYH
jgi:hypothetical protein